MQDLTASVSVLHHHCVSFKRRFNIFYLELDFSTFMCVLLNGVADIERLFRLDVACLRTLSESNTVHYIVRFVIHQFQLDMFLVASYHFACTIIVHIQCGEYRFRGYRDRKG